MDVHSSLSAAFCCHLLTFIACRTFSTSTQPSQSQSPSLSTYVQFTPKYFLNCPSLIHSNHMSNPL
jgi:hypothetical protein